MGCEEREGGGGGERKIDFNIFRREFLVRSISRRRAQLKLTRAKRVAGKGRRSLNNFAKGSWLQRLCRNPGHRLVGLAHPNDDF